MPTTPAPSTTTLAGQHAGDAAHEHAAAAERLLQVRRADLCGHAAGDLGHRGEQRQRAVGKLDRLVGDAHGAGAEEAHGLLVVGGEVQVGVEDLAGAQPLDLDRLRLLDLDDHVGASEDLVGGVDELGTGGDVLGVGERGAVAGGLLDENRVAVRDELARAARRHADAELVVLDLLGHSNDHVRTPFRSSAIRSDARRSTCRACIEIEANLHQSTPSGAGFKTQTSPACDLWSISYYDAIGDTSGPDGLRGVHRWRTCACRRASSGDG